MKKAKRDGISIEIHANDNRDQDSPPDGLEFWNIASSFQSPNVIELLLLSSEQEVTVTKRSRIRLGPLKKHGATGS